MNSGRNIEDLAVYQKAMQFVMSIYGLISVLPKEEEYGLAKLLKQAAVSITSNIGDGSKQKGEREKTRYLNNAQDALSECRYYLNFVSEQGYAETSDLLSQLKAVETLLEELLNYTESD